MEYTKGQWEIKSQEIVSGNKIIATVSMNQDEFKANANLIASSPRMFEFIQLQAKQGNTQAIDFLKTLALS
jgi:hypothetical protein